MRNNIVRPLLAGCLLLMIVVTSRALPYRFFDDEQLSSNLITAICQDKQGYIWVGTEYGLNKFDGVRMKQYYSNDEDTRSLSDNIVRRLMTDRDGRLWVVTNQGVQRYSRMSDSFETVSFGESLTANANDILQRPDGKIWVLTAYNGVYDVDPEKMVAVPVEAVNKHIDQNEQADNLYLDSRGRLWVAYEGSGLLQITLKTGKPRYYEEQLQPRNRAVDVTEDKSQRLTVLTYTGVMQLNEQTQQLEQVIDYPRNSVVRFFKDAGGQLFIGTSGSGLWRVDTERRELLRINDPLPAGSTLKNEKVYAYLEDRDGNRWIGCHQRGLLQQSARTEPFHYMPLSQLSTDNGRVLRSLYADSRKNVYVCQEKGGIAVCSPDGQTKGVWMSGLTVMGLYEDRHGVFWAGTYRNGLYRIDPRTGREEPMPQTEGQRIGSITTDSSGNLYTAVFNDGLHSYTPDGRTERMLGGGRLKLTNPYLNKLFTAKDGKIWIGHYYGIDVYDPKADRLMDMPVPEALRPAIVYAIAQSNKDNTIWIGSNKGLFQYSGNGQWKRFTTKDGLPNDIVCGIVVATDGTLWVSTYRGLAQVDSDGTFTRYYRGNGLEEWSYLRGVYAWSGIGEVILGNQNGITYFNPEKITKDEFRRGISLTAMRLGDADVNATTRTNDSYIITKPLDEATDITVSYLDNTFSLRFSSMDYRDAQNVHYEFRFEGGSDQQWYQTESGRSEIYFSHLSAGTHRLVVRAYDNGVYSPEKTILIHVTPPWYRSTGAYVFYLMIIMAIAVLWWRNYWNKRQADINEEKIKFFVDISHELRSPLTLIKSPLDKLLSEKHDASTIRALRNIEHNTNRLLTLTNQILSIRKMEKGQMKLHFAETPLADFISDICHDYDYRVEKHQLTLTFDNQAGDMKVWIDRDNFDKVVANLIGNAIKYVQDGGEIIVTLRQTEDGQAELSVKDNGPGIDEAQLRKVFERFYQASAHPVGGQMSYGIGLNLTRKIVDMHKGVITARNRTDVTGSEFIVRLPLGHQHLPERMLVDNDYFVETPSPHEGSSSLITDANRPRKVRKKTNYRIAVVDDDEEIRNFLQTELGETYHVQTYPDGMKALEGIVDTIPDLVVSDVVMPQMDGFELLKRLKGITKTSHIPVVMLTTKTEHQSRVEGLEYGADAYVDKPFNLEELEANIAALIANRIRVKGKFMGIQEQEDTVRKVELKGNDAALMEKIMKAVNERLDDSDFNVEALADDVGLSRVQLHRRMKELTGITVGEFIRNLRLQQAAKLLEAGDITVSQVTYAVGFANPTHFSSAFKKHFGVTPSEYMVKHQS